MARIAFTKSIDLESKYITAVTCVRHGPTVAFYYVINVHMAGDGNHFSYMVEGDLDETPQDLTNRAEAERQRVVELVWPNSTKADVPPPRQSAALLGLA